MRKKRTNENTFAMLDPLYGYPEMMSADDIAEFAGIGKHSALKWMQENGGVMVIKGQVRNVWRIHKEYVRRHFNLPRITA